MNKPKMAEQSPGFDPVVHQGVDLEVALEQARREVAEEIFAWVEENGQPANLYYLLVRQ